MPSRTPIALASLALAAGAATCEPVVVRTAITDTKGVPDSIDLRAVDSRLPGLVFHTSNLGSGGGKYFEYPVFDLFDVYKESDCTAASDSIEVSLTDNDIPLDAYPYGHAPWNPERSTEAGELAPEPATEDRWTQVSICTPGFTELPSLLNTSLSLFGFVSCDSPPAPPTESDLYELGPVVYYPIRLSHPDGGLRYGWMALQSIALGQGEDCNPYCGVNWAACGWPSLIYRGVGFESEPDTPIVVGGGLCPADLTFDAVLDLADLVSFVTAFTDQTDSGDYDDNGIFDLSDVQGFIGDFTTGCGL